MALRVTAQPAPFPLLVLVIVLAVIGVDLASSPPAARSAAQSPASDTYLNVSLPSRDDAFVGAAKGSSFFILETRSSGASWRHFRLRFGIDSPTVSQTGSSEPMSPIQFLNGTTGWIMGYSLTQCQAEAPQDQWTCDDGLYATRDGGQKWVRQIGLGQTGLISGFQFLNPTTGWAITSRCRVPATRAIRRAAGGGMVCGFDQKILHTTNGGRSWRPAGDWPIFSRSTFSIPTLAGRWPVRRRAPIRVRALSISHPVAGTPGSGFSPSRTSARRW